MSNWVKVTWNIEAPAKQGSHRTRLYKCLRAWPVCERCGLIFLKNKPTFKLIKAGCDG